MRTLIVDSNKAALTGFIFALPFIITNFIVALRIEPFYSFLGSLPVIRNSPFLPLFLLLLFPIGAFIAIRPMLHRGERVQRKIYIVNCILATIMLIIFFILFFALGEEAYRCDVLHLPNCD